MDGYLCANFDVQAELMVPYTYCSVQQMVVHTWPTFLDRVVS